MQSSRTTHPHLCLNIQKITLLSCVLSLNLLGCNESNAPQTTATATHPIELIPQDLVQPEQKPITEQIPFTGTIRAVEQSSIQSQVLASIKQVNVQVGQSVQANQILVSLNNQDNAARLAQAQANLASSQAQARQDQLMMQRKKRLLDQGFIPQVEYEQSQVEYQSQIENVRAQQAAVNIALKAEQDGQIRSPINGIITKRLVEPGQTVSVGQTLLEIVNPAQLEIQAQLPVEQSAHLKLDQSITFKFNDQTPLYTAKLSRISPIADLNSRQIDFFAKPQQTLPSRSIGSFIEGNIILQSHIKGWTIPLNTIQNLEHTPYVWTVRQKKIQKVPIHVIYTNYNQNHAIIQGLNPDDLVSTIPFNEQDLNKTVIIHQQ